MPLTKKEQNTIAALRAIENERKEKLETAVRAGLALRRSLIDDGPQMKMLSAPRAAVEKFDATIKELSK